ncbi:MAG: hypothetical protein P1V35_11110 [Planctomycetota bacterium]|nr:hypothetical protein [Planctomycetota bacterium]
MKILLLSVLASFIVSFITVRGLQQDSEAASVASGGMVPVDYPANLQGDMAALLEKNEALSARVSFLENQPTSEVRIPVEVDWVPREDFLTLQEELRSATKAMANLSSSNVDLAHPQFRDQLGTALDEIRKAEAVGRVEALQEKRAATLEPVLAKMQARMGLTQPQVTQLRGALESKMAMDSERTRRWQEGEDSAVLGQFKADNRTAHQEELARILTPSQFDQLQQGRAGK